MARRSKVRIEVHGDAVEELLRSPEVAADLKRRADAIAAAAGPGHEVTVQIGRNRARASVRTETWEAKYAEAVDRTLLRAIDAGRR